MPTFLLPILLQLLSNAPKIVGDVEGVLSDLKQADQQQHDDVLTGLGHLLAGMVSYAAKQAEAPTAGNPQPAGSTATS
jgi:hypothetical protein